LTRLLVETTCERILPKAFCRVRFNIGIEIEIGIEIVIEFDFDLDNLPQST